MEIAKRGKITLREISGVAIINGKLRSRLLVRMHIGENNRCCRRATQK